MRRENLKLSCATIIVCALAVSCTQCVKGAETDVAPLKPDASSDLDARWIRLDNNAEVWISRERDAVMVGGQVCLREGFLEMFACPKRTKEHESIVSVNSPAFMVHAALLAIGVKAGNPAQYDKEYTPADGREIDVQVTWTSEDGVKKGVRAQDWVREMKTGQSMKYSWIFLGSGFWTDSETGKRYYHAEGGELICVSNFATAMMDLPIPSSQSNEDLLFQAFTQRIPPLRTKVRLILKPKVEKTANRDLPKRIGSPPTAEAIRE